MAKRFAAVFAAVFAATVLATVGIGTVPAAASPAAPAAVPWDEMRAALARIPNAGTVRCWAGVTLGAHANGRYVSMRVEETGRLSAVGPLVRYPDGAWENFQVCRAQGNAATYIYQHVASRYVSVRLDQGGAVRATGAAPGPWELFYTSGNPHQSPASTTVLHANADNSYVSVRIEDGGRMRTGFRDAGPWEVYTW